MDTGYANSFYSAGASCDLSPFSFVCMSRLRVLCSMQLLAAGTSFGVGRSSTDTTIEVGSESNRDLRQQGTSAVLSEKQVHNASHPG